jgi:hypothetical protein|tara:strand:- start:14565 stop:15071 length:507 start_codon:yes stop_codon:yes gene_type:complete
MRTKTAREIKVTTNFLNNKRITAKIGAPKNREHPETVYISISFWTRPIDEYLEYDKEKLKSILRKELKRVYKGAVDEILGESEVFNHPDKNIFIENIPDNINYNGKRNYINFEIYLHTCNIGREEKKPLNQKEGEDEIFQEAINVINYFGDSEILNDGSGFIVYSKNR